MSEDQQIRRLPANVCEIYILTQQTDAGDLRRLAQENGAAIRSIAEDFVAERVGSALKVKWLLIGDNAKSKRYAHHAESVLTIRIGADVAYTEDTAVHEWQDKIGFDASELVFQIERMMALEPSTLLSMVVWLGQVQWEESYKRIGANRIR